MISTALLAGPSGWLLALAASVFAGAVAFAVVLAVPVVAVSASHRNRLRRLLSEFGLLDHAARVQALPWLPQEVVLALREVRALVRDLRKELPETAAVSLSLARRSLRFSSIRRRF